MQSDPLAWWQSEFGEIAPRGHILRSAFGERWVRFHSLPDAKRYAETEAEHLEVQRRHLAVASALFKSGEPLYVFRAHEAEARTRGKARHQLAGRQFREAVAVLPTVATTEDVDRFLVRVLVSKWKPDFFEAAIRLLANWHEAGVSFVSPATKNILCPYDGGMDVFAFSFAPLELGARFGAWRSTRPDGL